MNWAQAASLRQRGLKHHINKMGVHGKAYREEIYNRLNGLKKEDFLATLATIKQELHEGRTWETATTKKLNKCVR